MYNVQCNNQFSINILRPKLFWVFSHYIKNQVCDALPMMNLKVVNPVFHPRGAWSIIGPESHPPAFRAWLYSSTEGTVQEECMCIVQCLSIWGAVRCIWDSGQSYRCCKGENAASQIDALSSQKLRYMAPRTFFHLLLSIAPNFFV